MTKVLLLSDTHSHVDDRILHYASLVDEVWHAGDIGSMDVIQAIEKITPVRAVYGNIDGQDIRTLYPEFNEFHCEKVKILMTHIGGYPPKYGKGIKEKLQQSLPKLFICGHSHILKVIHDPTLGVLHMNPGAAGKSGFHKVRTMIRFEIDHSDIRNMEVIEFNTKD